MPSPPSPADLEPSPVVPGTVQWHGYRCLLPVRLSTRYPGATCPAPDAGPVPPDQRGGGSEADILLEAFASSCVEGVTPEVADYARAVAGAFSTSAGNEAQRCARTYPHAAGFRRFSSSALACATMLGVPPRWRSTLVRLDGGTSTCDPFYPPPPVFLRDLIEDLDLFAAHRASDPVAHAAITHAQFETIHPLHDGNGRVGRALLSQTLWSAGVPGTVSVFLARNRSRYLRSLAAFAPDTGKCGDDTPMRDLIAEASTAYPPLPAGVAVTGDRDLADRDDYTCIDGHIWMRTDLWDSAQALRTALERTA